jgi:cyclophilin family peptidyl-prolyl cis-trans isomerase
MPQVTQLDLPGQPRQIRRMRERSSHSVPILCAGARWHSALCGLIALPLLSCREPPPALVLGPPPLELVLEGLPATRPLPARLITDRGTLHCELEPERTPRASAMFIGFALGRAAWKPPGTELVTERPLYRDLDIVRGVPGVLIQSGDPIGNTAGNPGYRIAVEVDSDDARRLAQPGALILARYMPPPDRVDPAPPPPGHVLGSQFAVLLTDMSHLAGQVSVLGHCGDLELARTIAEEVAADRARPKLIEVRVP